MKLSILLLITFILCITITNSLQNRKLRKLGHKLKSQHRHSLRHRKSMQDDTTSTSASASASSSSSVSTSTSTSSEPPLPEWAQAHTFSSVLKNPEFPKDKCIVPNAALADPAAAALKSASGKVVKHLEMNKKRVSVGAASYFFDQTDFFLLNHFEADVKESWKAFWNNANPEHRGDEELMDGGIDTQALNVTITESQWTFADRLDFTKLLREYAIEVDVYDKDTSTVNLQELTYLNIRENIKDNMEETECENCLKKTKVEIDTFFDYLDCDQNGMISAENTYHGMQNMKKLQYEHTTTSMINAFFVNTMEHHSAALDKRDFQFSLLTGMFERVIHKTHMTEKELNAMKVTRRSIIEKGGGPAR